jgi:simple sugar transport system ATP-binding protein
MLGTGEPGGRASQPPARQLDARDAPRPPVIRAERVTVVDATGRVRIQSASFVVGAGEIVGVAGVEGSGQRELLRAIAGRLPLASGRLERPATVGFVPEDRHRDAILLDRSLIENVALRGAGARRGLIEWSEVGARTESLMRAFDVRAAGPRVPMRTVSGGNQQKLVLARELDLDVTTSSRAIVVENPTRGLDVRATTAVHDRLRAARDAGAAVVVYSSDIDEVLLLATRVLVVYAGTVREASVDRDIVGRLMLGAERDADQ